MQPKSRLVRTVGSPTATCIAKVARPPACGRRQTDCCRTCCSSPRPCSRPLPFSQLAATEGGAPLLLFQVFLASFLPMPFVPVEIHRGWLLREFGGGPPVHHVTVSRGGRWVITRIYLAGILAMFWRLLRSVARIESQERTRRSSLSPSIYRLTLVWSLLRPLQLPRMCMMIKKK